MDLSRFTGAMIAEQGAIGGAERSLTARMAALIAVFCATYAFLHVFSLNLYPIETWSYRILHVLAGVGLAFLLVSGHGREQGQARMADRALSVAGLVLVALGSLLYLADLFGDPMAARAPTLAHLRGGLLVSGVVLSLFASWFCRETTGKISLYDAALACAAVAVGGYTLANVTQLQFRAGVLPTVDDIYVTTVGALLIIETTRRLTGYALAVISAVFLGYGLFGQLLPGMLQHSGYSFGRLITYLFTDNGILGTTVSVSSTYLVLFVVFAAFLQVTGVGDYFVRLSFSLAGHARGGPAKVAVLASALMGMINGSSAGNVVATGSFTIPLMKKVGYPPRSAAAIEAAASTGGQIMPPIMGAGAFIMAELTGIPYTDLMVAAVLPAVLYFASVYFMVDFEAAKTGMKGLPRTELPAFSELARHIFLLAPIFVLILAMFLGYSVIRAGTLACIASAVLSFAGPQPLNLGGIFRCFRDATRMLLQLVVVCACAGIIVGVIGLTGIGLKFSALLLQLAAQNELIALLAAMFVTILLGMGMPTTAAYAIGASVIAPGLIKLGVPVLTAHLFVFYYAVVSAITPPVAMAGFAAAGVVGTDPMKTSLRSFAVGSAAFLVPLAFFYNGALLLEGTRLQVALALVEGLLMVTLLAAVLQGWLLVPLTRVARALLLIAIGLLVTADLSLTAIAIGTVVVVVGASVALARWKASVSVEGLALGSQTK